MKLIKIIIFFILYLVFNKNNIFIGIFIIHKKMSMKVLKMGMCDISRKFWLFFKENFDVIFSQKLITLLGIPNLFITSLTF